MEQKNVRKVNVGVDMGGTRIKIGLVQDDRLLDTMIIPAAAGEKLADQLEEIAVQVNKVLQRNHGVALGIGIAFPGIVNTDTKKILSKYVKYPDAGLIDLDQWANSHWNIPAVLENDVKAALYGEWQQGAGKNCQDLVMITLGTGVGSAVMMNGRMLRGVNNHAGNLGGHMTLNFRGKICNCGNLGCLESEASTWALKKDIPVDPRFVKSLLSKEDEISFYSIFQCADKGDLLAIDIKERCLDAWALGILNLIIAYDPARVIIGGGIMNSPDLVIPRTLEFIAKDVWLQDNPIEILPAKQLEFAGILGLNYSLNQKSELKKLA